MMDETPARRALLAAMDECDLGPDRTARELSGILKDPETSGSLRAKVAMNIAELQGAMPSRKTQVDVNARSLLQVKVSQVDTADEIFSKLMGDTVEPRREFIQDNALAVANLDV